MKIGVKLLINFKIVTLNFPNTSEAQNSYYYLGVTYYNLQEYEFANEAFTDYLKCHQNPESSKKPLHINLLSQTNFVTEPKSAFSAGNRCQKLLPSPSYALEIYNEVIATMPTLEIAAQALYAKQIICGKQQIMKKASTSISN